MSKKVLIISSSLRGGSNSECLARECERGAKDAGHDVQFISLKGKELKFCIGCLSCLQYCPTGAISLGGITEKRARYHNARVSAADLCQKIIHID